MNKKDIIQEFLDSTPHWVDQVEDFKDKPCVMCGSIPTKMIELFEAVRKLKEKACMPKPTKPKSSCCGAETETDTIYVCNTCGKPCALKSQVLPCPHGRDPIGDQDGWKHCPHCLGLN